MNIFARELASILSQHGKGLGSLYGLHSPKLRLFPNKVTRLKRSLSEDLTATLNAEELELLQEWVPLDPEGEELRRLHAALLAEAVRHLLSGRMDRDAASQLSEITFQLLLGQEPKQLMLMRDKLLEAVRGDVVSLEVPKMGAAADQIEWALEAGIETYEQGTLWLEVARETTARGARLGYLAQARTLLSRALDLVADAPTISQGTSEQQEWLTIIEATLAKAVSLS